MDLSGIISIAGMSGLYKVVAQTKSGFVVEALIDKKRIPVYAANKVSTLEEVRIYSTDEEVALKVVLQKIYDKENGGHSIDHKSADAELKAYFNVVFPQYDKERVYCSDIKKVISWYNALHKEGLLGKKDKDKLDVPKKNVAKYVKVGAKTKAKETSSKPLKTASSKVKTQGVRKTGVA